jgi:DNA modification methylase
MMRQMESTTNIGDAVWEPFGGLASASVAAVGAGRRAFVAEVDPAFKALAVERLEAAASVRRDAQQTAYRA